MCFTNSFLHFFLFFFFFRLGHWDKTIIRTSYHNSYNYAVHLEAFYPYRTSGLCRCCLCFVSDVYQVAKELATQVKPVGIQNLKVEMTSASRLSSANEFGIREKTVA